jgi:ethanolamine utilization protein EutP (predicted NTPase)
MILYLCHIYIIIYPHLKNSLHSAPRSPQHFSQVALKPQVIVVNKVDLPEVQAGLGDAEDGTRMDYTNHIHIYIYIIIYMYIYITL